MSKKRRGEPTYKSQTFLGEVIEKNGKRGVALGAPRLYRHFLDATCKVGDKVAMTITNRRPRRTTQQNRYYWLYLTLITESTGHSPDELHAWVKSEFLVAGIAEVFGYEVRVLKSTTDLSVGEFCELVMRIEDTTQIPSPDTAPFLNPLTKDERDALKVEQRRAYSKLERKLVIHTGVDKGLTDDTLDL